MPHLRFTLPAGLSTVLWFCFVVAYALLLLVVSLVINSILLLLLDATLVNKYLTEGLKLKDVVKVIGRKHGMWRRWAYIDMLPLLIIMHVFIH